VRHFWIPLLFVSASLGFAQAQPWDKRTYDQALADPKKTVVDYFLLCPDIWLDSSGNFYVSPKVAAGRGAFEDRKNLLRKGFSTQGVSVDSVVVDIANAYISISGNVDPFRFRLTFVFFDRQGKSDIPAYSYYSDGIDAGTYECPFYELDSANAWTDVTDKLVPALSLSDLENGAQKHHGAYPDVEWEYILPQKGTTVLAVPHLTYHREDADSPRAVDKLVQELLNRKLELLWDNKQGRFTKGVLLQ
jgi:hypothetical protein